MPIFSEKRGYLHLLLALLLILTCVGMALLQLWRAESRGERFEREQAARTATPIELSARQREREKLLDRPVTARGRWLGEKTLYVDNKIHNGRAGYHVLTPLQLSGSAAVVLVNRGWAPTQRLRSELPPVSSEAGEVAVSGVTRNFETRTFELQESAPQGAVWQHVRESEYRRHSGLDALPVILLQTDPGGDGLIRDRASPENPAAKHYGYAAMWLVFSLMAAAYGLFAWRKQ